MLMRRKNRTIRLGESGANIMASPVADAFADLFARANIRSSYACRASSMRT